MFKVPLDGLEFNYNAHFEELHFKRVHVLLQLGPTKQVLQLLLRSSNEILMDFRKLFSQIGTNPKETQI